MNSKPSQKGRSLIYQLTRHNPFYTMSKSLLFTSSSSSFSSRAVSGTYKHPDFLSDNKNKPRIYILISIDVLSEQLLPLLLPLRLLLSPPSSQSDMLPPRLQRADISTPGPLPLPAKSALRIYRGNKSFAPSVRPF